jgi:adenine-specific DNA methylase
MPIERDFDVSFIARLTAEEKQIQQNYRPVIGVHKWFARRPGALFRGLLLAEFADATPLAAAYLKGHRCEGITVADPFMGGGTTLFEANRIGCNVVGFDINPMAYWVVRQELSHVERNALRAAAIAVIADVQAEVGDLYLTTCEACRCPAPIKYFLWVKRQRCAGCAQDLDLFPGYLVAENERHTHFVLHCPACKKLVPFEQEPRKDRPVTCPECEHSFCWGDGPASRNRYTCPACKHVGRYPAELREEGPPRNRLFGIEYHCPTCRSSHRGRFFKTPDADDLDRFDRAAASLALRSDLCLPEDEIQDGDETKRLHRWGYRRYRDMFNSRQLYSLGVLLRRIQMVRDTKSRHALATVFSDCLRYQNMLCRYDEYALKCQDIFAVHGFPVGLVQCENNVLGIPKIGAGGFRHFVEKYDRAKEYCERPFETVKSKKHRKRLVHVPGERIEASLVTNPRDIQGIRKAYLRAGSIEDARFPEGTFDAVFTDPPYFDNVQYAELMDFCYVWLRLLLSGDFRQFGGATTRSPRELTGNNTAGKDLAHFTAGLSRVFGRAAHALKSGGPFVFTYHHNDVEAYVPVVVALLDAGLYCTATLPCPAEMSASLHIHGTGSSVMDTIVVSRKLERLPKMPRFGKAVLRDWLQADRTALAAGGVRTSRGDLACLALGHLARVAVASLLPAWQSEQATPAKMETVRTKLETLVEKADVDALLSGLLSIEVALHKAPELTEPSLFDQVL